MKKLNIAKLYDQPGWAYYWIGQEMSRYSRHVIIPEAYNDVSYDNKDIILISSPNISYSLSAVRIPLECKKRGIKVIGQYSGEVDMQYQYADLIVAISPQLYFYAKEKYPNTPVIFLPESIDTEFFVPTKYKTNSRLTVGWAGGKNKPIKRAYLLEKLNYPVKIQSNHGKQFFTKQATLDPMREFYQSIDAYVLLSITECMPRVIMEAMSSGLPVIATDVGAVPLLLSGDMITSVFPDDKVIQQVNERLDALVNREFRESIGNDNRLFVEENFSWKVNMPKWDDVFSALKENDFRKIQEINDFYLSKFSEHFVMTDKYAEQIARFEQMRGLGNHLRVMEKTGNDFFDFIIDLNKSGIKYWLAKDTCLDTIIYGETTAKYIYLQTDPLYYKDLENYISLKSPEYKKIDIVLVPSDRKRNVKPMTLNNLPVMVPYPVTNYLIGQFGKDWIHKYNELHPDSKIPL